MSSRALLFGLAVAICLSGSMPAADPPTTPESLPQPRPVPSPVLSMPLELTVEFPRPDPMAVWQNYGVTWNGYYLPLVVQTPYGSYYRYNGKPFYFTYNYPRERMVTEVGTPYGPPRQVMQPPLSVPDFMPYIVD